MIGMSFGSFILLLVISVVAALILHYAAKVYIVTGLTSLISKVVIGWIGAWLGSPVLGHWWTGVAYEQVYIVPAILGSFALQVLAVNAIRTLAAALDKRPAKPGSPVL